MQRCFGFCDARLMDNVKSWVVLLERDPESGALLSDCVFESLEVLTLNNAPIGEAPEFDSRIENELHHVR